MLAALQIVQSPEKAGVLLQPGRLRLLEQLTVPDSAAGLARRLGVPRQKLNYHLRELEREGFLELIEERRKGNCMERVVRAVARAFLIAPQTGDRVTADRFSAAYLASTAARMIRELASLCIRARPAFAEEMTATIAHLAAKYHNERTEGGRRFRLLSAVYPAVRLEESASESANLE